MPAFLIHSYLRHMTAKRTWGVTFSGIVAILGSACLLLFALLMAFVPASGSLPPTLRHF